MTCKTDRDGNDQNRLAVQVWGEALRSPTVLAMVQDSQRQLRSGYLALARQWVAHGRLPADADLESVAAFLFAIVPGFILQLLILEDVQPQTFAAVLTALLGWQPGPGTGAEGQCAANAASPAGQV